MTVWVQEKDGVLEGVGFVGEGCAISQASSSIMAGLVKGKTVEEFAKQLAEVQELLTGEEEPVVDLSTMGIWPPWRECANFRRASSARPWPGMRWRRRWARSEPWVMNFFDHRFHRFSQIGF